MTAGETEMEEPNGRPTPQQFAQASWAEILALYERLATEPLEHANAAEWLDAWSALAAALGEAEALAWIAYSADTRDPVKEANHLRWSGEIAPLRREQDIRLTDRLLALGFSRPDLETTLRQFRNQRELFRAESIPLLQEIEEHSARYAKLTGGMTAEWDGEEIPLPLLAPYRLDPDRGVRERAFRLQAAPYVAARDELAALFDRQYALRQQVAHNAGLATYRDYAFRDFNRFDYKPADCEAFREAIEATVIPLLARRRERRRERLGVATLRPWDLGVDPLGRPPLRPYGTAAELVERAGTVFASLDPTLGGYFATMATEGLLDLDTRPGKQPAGYCTNLPYRRRPFIFMTGAGVADDVTTILHEGGHAFHSFEAFALPLVFQWDPGAEMAEVASMAMELLAAPYLDWRRGGFYDDADLRRARTGHLELVLRILAGVTLGDAFQSWIYTSGQGHDPAARDAAWLQLSERFDPVVDWSGLEAERIADWYDILHFFMAPFYAIEYGLAQMAALQIWRNSRRDEAEAIAAYRRALALGGTRPLPELYAAAGARLVFDTATMAELVGMVEAELNELDA